MGRRRQPPVSRTIITVLTCHECIPPHDLATIEYDGRLFHVAFPSGVIQVGDEITVLYRPPIGMRGHRLVWYDPEDRRFDCSIAATHQQCAAQPSSHWRSDREWNITHGILPVRR